MKIIFNRIAIAPFEAAIAVLAFVSGLTGLAHIGIIDPLAALLPMWESFAINSMLVVCGVAIFTGLATVKGRVEILGLWLLDAAILARLLTYGQALGFGRNFILTAVFDLAVIIAGAIRINSISRHHILIRVESSDIDDEYDVIS